MIALIVSGGFKNVSILKYNKNSREGLSKLNFVVSVKRHIKYHPRIKCFSQLRIAYILDEAKKKKKRG